MNQFVPYLFGYPLTAAAWWVWLTSRLAGGRWVVSHTRRHEGATGNVNLRQASLCYEAEELEGIACCHDSLQQLIRLHLHSVHVVHSAIV